MGIRLRNYWHSSVFELHQGQEETRCQGETRGGLDPMSLSTKYGISDQPARLCSGSLKSSRTDTKPKVRGFKPSFEIRTRWWQMVFISVATSNKPVSFGLHVAKNKPLKPRSARRSDRNTERSLRYWTWRSFGESN